MCWENKYFVEMLIADEDDSIDKDCVNKYGNDNDDYDGIDTYDIDTLLV